MHDKKKISTHIHSATLNVHPTTDQSQSIHADESTRVQLEGAQPITDGFDQNVVFACIV